MGKRFSCIRKNRSRQDVTNEEDDNDQPENYSLQFQQYLRISPGHDQAVQVNGDQSSLENRPDVVPTSQDDQETTVTEQETPGGLSYASPSTALPQDTSNVRSTRSISSVSSSAVELVPFLPTVTLTDPENQNVVLEPGGIANPGETRQESDSEEPEEGRTRPHTPGLAFRRMQQLREKAKSTVKTSSASEKAKKWYKRVKGQIGSSLGKASSGAPKAKEFYRKIKSKFETSSQTATSSSTGAKKKEYQSDDAQPGPSGIRKSSSKSETSSKDSSSSKSKGSKGKKQKNQPNERKLLRENARAYGYNLNRRLQLLRGGNTSDPVLSMSYQMVSRPTSRQRQTEARHSWTPGLSRDDSVESNQQRIILVRPSRSIPTSSNLSASGPSRSSLTLELPISTITSPPRSLCSPSSPTPQRRSMLPIRSSDTRELRDALRRRTSNTLQVPGSNLPALDLPGPEFPEVPQEEPVPTTSISQRKRSLALPVFVSSSAFARVPQKSLRLEGPKKKTASATPKVPQEKPSTVNSQKLTPPTLSGTPQEEQSLVLPEVPQEEVTPAIREVAQEPLATPEVSQEGLSPAVSRIPLEEQPLELSQVSGDFVPLLELAQEESTTSVQGVKKVLQKDPSSARPDVSTLPEVSQEEPLPQILLEQPVALPEVSGEAPFVALPENPQEEQFLVLPEVTQEETTPAIREVPQEGSSPASAKIPLEEQPLALSDMSGEFVPWLKVIQKESTLETHSKKVIQERSSSARPDVSTVPEVSQEVPLSQIPLEQPVASPEVCGEEQLVASPEIAQEEPTPVILEHLQGEPSPDVLTDIPHEEHVPALFDICQKVIQQEFSLVMPGIPQEKPSTAKLEVPQKETSPPLSGTPQEEITSPIREVSQEKPFTIMSEDFVVTTPEVSQEESSPTVPKILLEEQPLVLSEVSGEFVPWLELVQRESTSETHDDESVALPENAQEEPTPVILDDSQAEPFLHIPTDIQEKLSTSLPTVSHEEQSLVLPDIRQKEQALAAPEVIQQEVSRTMLEIPQEETSEVSEAEPSLAISEVSQEGSSFAIPEIIIEEPPLVPQEEPLPAIPEARDRWLAVPESSHIDDSDYHSSD